MIEYDFHNILRLDSCFRFLTLQERIHLHQSSVSEKYFQKLPEHTRQKLVTMAKILENWMVPRFHKLREDADCNRYWVQVICVDEDYSEAYFSKIYQEEFEEFVQIMQKHGYGITRTA